MPAESSAVTVAGSSISTPTAASASVAVRSGLLVVEQVAVGVVSDRFLLGTARCAEPLEDRGRSGAEFFGVGHTCHTRSLRGGGQALVERFTWNTRDSSVPEPSGDLIRSPIPSAPRRARPNRRFRPRASSGGIRRPESPPQTSGIAVGTAQVVLWTSGSHSGRRSPEWRRAWVPQETLGIGRQPDCEAAGRSERSNDGSARIAVTALSTGPVHGWGPPPAWPRARALGGRPAGRSPDFPFGGAGWPTSSFATRPSGLGPPSLVACRFRSPAA